MTDVHGSVISILDKHAGSCVNDIEISRKIDDGGLLFYNENDLGTPTDYRTMVRYTDVNLAILKATYAFSWSWTVSLSRLRRSFKGLPLSQIISTSRVG